MVSELYICLSNVSQSMKIGIAYSGTGGLQVSTGAVVAIDGGDSGARVSAVIRGRVLGLTTLLRLLPFEGNNGEATGSTPPLTPSVAGSIRVSIGGNLLGLGHSAGDNNLCTTKTARGSPLRTVGDEERI